MLKFGKGAADGAVEIGTGAVLFRISAEAVTLLSGSDAALLYNLRRSRLSVKFYSVGEFFQKQ